MSSGKLFAYINWVIIKDLPPGTAKWKTSTVQDMRVVGCGIASMPLQVGIFLPINVSPSQKLPESHCSGIFITP
jgi:hypothetical protein